ncbi:MAG: beta-lactamase family protein [Bryobacterales bacterium]|nr:beta-lactamase family protein [Bryobacterales bacterium]
MKTGKTPGLVIGVMHKGKVIFAKGYGLANVELDVPVTPSTVFKINSMTKQFTATAIMLLAERGLLRTDDSLARFFPDFPRASEITVKQPRAFSTTSFRAMFRSTMARSTEMTKWTNILITVGSGEYPSGKQFHITRRQPATGTRASGGNGAVRSTALWLATTTSSAEKPQWSSGSGPTQSSLVAPLPFFGDKHRHRPSTYRLKRLAPLSWEIGVTPPAAAVARPRHIPGSTSHSKTRGSPPACAIPVRRARTRHRCRVHASIGDNAVPWLALLPCPIADIGL